MKSCPTCSNEQLSLGSVSETTEVMGRRFHALLPAWICSNCNENFVSDSDLERYELAIAGHLAKAPPSAQAFAYMRRALGLKALELAELLHARAETVSRWERGVRSIDWRAFALLGKLVLERIEGSQSTRRYLELLRDSNPAEVVELGELNP